ncbi:hypothetical protein REPUB_Repub19eG0062400 [Reevesia pubescens]
MWASLPFSTPLQSFQFLLRTFPFVKSSLMNFVLISLTNALNGFANYTSPKVRF